MLWFGMLKHGTALSSHVVTYPTMIGRGKLDVDESAREWLCITTPITSLCVCILRVRWRFTAHCMCVCAPKKSCMARLWACVCACVCISGESCRVIAQCMTHANQRFHVICVICLMCAMTTSSHTTTSTIRSLSHHTCYTHPAPFRLLPIVYFFKLSTCL
jgi:hypothetical protein